MKCLVIFFVSLDAYGATFCIRIQFCIEPSKIESLPLNKLYIDCKINHHPNCLEEHAGKVQKLVQNCQVDGATDFPAAAAIIEPIEYVWWSTLDSKAPMSETPVEGTTAAPIGTVLSTLAVKFFARYRRHRLVLTCVTEESYMDSQARIQIHCHIQRHAHAQVYIHKHT